MATLDAETADALNVLLEDVRASVMIELALTDGATELRERDTLATMGSDEVLACCALRERLALANAPVTWRISGIVFHILSTERYDERLRAFARHQAAVCERAEALLAAVADRETHRLLQDLYDSHVRSARWAEQRANEFAASRLLDFTVRATGRLGATPAGVDDAVRARADGSARQPAAPTLPVPPPDTQDAAGIRRDADDGHAAASAPQASVDQDPPQPNDYAPPPESASPGTPPLDTSSPDSTAQDGEHGAHPDLEHRQE